MHHDQVQVTIYIPSEQCDEKPSSGDGVLAGVEHDGGSSKESIEYTYNIMHTR